MGACPDCGVDESRIGVSDAVAALRTFPRRFRESLQAADEAHESAVAQAELAAFARELAQSATALSAALGHPAAPGSGGADLAGLESTVAAMVAVADAAPWEAWDRSTRVDGEERSARAIVAHAAHLGSHHLRAISRAVPDAD